MDLQCVRRASPALDIAYLVGSSTNYDLRQSKKEEILRYYHKFFTREVERLGYNGDLYTYENLEQDFERARVWGVMMSYIHGIVST